MDDILKDSRFSHVSKDVRFKNVPKKEKKVKIDKRFQSMFTDERFQLKSAIDKRGRPVITKGSDNLEKYYHLSDDSSDSEDEKLDDDIGEAFKDVKVRSSEKHSSLAPEVKKKLQDLTVDYARGEGQIFPDSSSDEESSSEEEEGEIEHEWGELDKDAGTTEEPTRRLAACNMDWDRITAEDLMVLFNSFLPPGGLVKSVSIFPSEFGMKRMEEEEKQGPAELTSLPAKEDDKEEEDEISIEQRERLRQYQLKRLKYYYAVLEFDSAQTGNHVYEECDGLEYESSMNRLDLRFIPDDTTFDQEPREVCTETPDMSTYKPRLYRTSALTQVKVNLTWDETDPGREEAIRAAHEGKIDNSKLDNYLASSSSDEESDGSTESVSNKETSEKNAIDKYKQLLLGLEQEEEKTKEEPAMEITWDLKLEEKAAEKVKEAAKSKSDKTPFEMLMDKKKEKRKSKKEKRKEVGKREENIDENEEYQPFSDDDVGSLIDKDDPYFKEIVDGKSKKKTRKGEDEEPDQEKLNQMAELELLMVDEANEGPKEHFNLKNIEKVEKKSKKKRKLKKQKQNNVEEKDTFKIDVEDERFSAIYSSHLYNLDPADPQFKKTQATTAILHEKIRRHASEQPSPKKPRIQEEPKTESKIDPHLSLLVKSIKSKTDLLKKKIIKK